MKNFSFFRKKGYLIIDLFNSKEIDFIKKSIEKKILSQISKINQNKNFKYKNLMSFHKNKFDDLSHRKIFESNNRYVSIKKKVLSKMKKNKIILSSMNNIWGHNKNEIKWVASLKKKQIKKNVAGFRIVRPSNKFSKDVTGKHIDINVGGKICSDKNVLLTAWTPICGFSKKYSLILAPGSHLKDHSPKTYIKSGKTISKIFKKSYEKKFKFKRFSLNKGQAILFHPNLIHGGSNNLGSITRASIEIRYYNKKNIYLWNN